MTNITSFQPKWASAPGDTIADILMEKKMSVDEFARHMGQGVYNIHDLMSGSLPITITLARRLGEVLGASMEFWMSRDFQYRESIAKPEEKGWITELPLADMIKFGWLSPVPARADMLAGCLEFFGVPTVFAWREKYANLEQMAAFRKSPTFESRPAAVAAWLRKGELAAGKIHCDPWDPKKFQSSLSRIRSLSKRKDPTLFIPDLQKHCAKCGVAIVIVRAPSGCRASGATRFLSVNKALLQLSFRYLTDDQFWFTFFHEAGHLVLHGKKRLFLEGLESVSPREEAEANEFAENILVPTLFKSRLLRLPLNSREVIRFAVELNLSPGIIVGQLQHYKVIQLNQLNGLKRRFKWKD